MKPILMTKYEKRVFFVNMFQVVEDIDVVTLKKVEKLEWERKHG